VELKSRPLKNSKLLFLLLDQTLKKKIKKIQFKIVFKLLSNSHFLKSYPKTMTFKSDYFVFKKKGNKQTL
jgi:hypothetical protein